MINKTTIMCLAAIAFVVVLAFGSYTHGHRVATLKHEAAQAEIVQKAVDKAKEDWKASASITNAGLQNAQKTNERIVTIEKRIPTIVTNCADVGSDYAGVYNDIISAIQSSGGSVATPEVPTKPADDAASNN